MDIQPPDLRLDLGEGTSTQPAELSASVRIRPITVRFTEPGVPDLRIPLHSITSLRPVHHALHTNNSNNGAEGNLIFDLDEQIPASTIKHSDNSIVGDVVTELNEKALMGDETVRAVKERLGRDRDGVKGRRLRLIHAGRILRDGVKLVGYLEELDLRQRIQRRGVLRHLALNNTSRTERDEDGERRRDSDGEDEGEITEASEEGDDEEEKDLVEKKEIPVRELIDWLTTKTRPSDADSDTAASSYVSGHPSGENRSNSKSKGKEREPSYYNDLIRLTIRTAPTVYLQCSVGEIETASQLSASSPPATSAPLINADPSLGFGFGIDPDSSPSPTSPSADRHRGFNRLLDAGLSPTEISSIRSQFRSTHPLPQSYDLIQSQEHSQHLLELEESWMDNFTSPSNNLPEFGEGGGGGGAYMTVFQGLLVGFFAPPLIPLFWFRDKAHPSSLPNSLGGGEDEGEEDDEEVWERERGEMTRESVFGGTMQVAILFGVVAK